MKPVPVIAIFDVGKTNKKLFLFDEQYNIVFERSARFSEIKDEDGDPCENIDALRLSLFDSLNEVLGKKEFILKAINFSAYGASFVYLDKEGNVLTPLYNYLKKYPGDIQKKFYDTYGGEFEFAHRTASPVLGSLNSGLQLYRVKYEKPAVFKRIHCALHLPQYLSFLLTGKVVSDITSIGCHTGLWDFTKNKYHEWVEKEGVEDKLAPICPSSGVMDIVYQGHPFVSGIGLHDSSAALIPYLLNFKEPFVLISTGTWNITLNPFNLTPLTDFELQHDCLSYMSFEGNPVKASRLFAGYEHDEQLKLLASHFNKSLHFYKQVSYDSAIIKDSYNRDEDSSNLIHFKNYEEAYHHFMFNLLKKELASSDLVMTENVKRIFVDGGFSGNTLFMNMLAALYPGKEVYAATMAQSTSLGAALAIHDKWNTNALPSGAIDLKYYTSDLRIKF
ncbi:MAG: carbohydrate kinase [Bacteroidia bacterium]|nr:carbohydrate kinase [Bacteroidia bacterium]